MPSIAIQAGKAVVSAADTVGNLTVDSNAYLFPGANAWVTKDDGSLSYRVKILAVTGSTGLKVRRYPQTQDPNTGVYYDNDRAPGINYGGSDMSAFNGVATHIYQEAQTAPVDPAYAKRVLP
jgi:hypothetical protein